MKFYGVRVGHPEAIIRRDMHHVAAPGSGAGERGGIRQVAQHQFGIDARQIAPIAGRAHKQAQRVAARRQDARNR